MELVRPHINNHLQKSLTSKLANGLRTCLGLDGKKYSCRPNRPTPTMKHDKFTLCVRSRIEIKNILCQVCKACMSRTQKDCLRSVLINEVGNYLAKLTACPILCSISVNKHHRPNY